MLDLLILDHVVGRLHRGPLARTLKDHSLWCLMYMLLDASGMGAHVVGSVCCCKIALLGACTMYIICRM